MQKRKKYVYQTLNKIAKNCSGQVRVDLKDRDEEIIVTQVKKRSSLQLQSERWDIRAGKRQRQECVSCIQSSHRIGRNQSCPSRNREHQVIVFKIMAATGLKRVHSYCKTI